MAAPPSSTGMPQQYGQQQYGGAPSYPGAPPQQQPGYPGAVPQQQQQPPYPGAPTQPGAYPGQPGAYPPQNQPPQQYNQNPGYPPQQPGYPGAVPQAGGYPGQPGAPGAPGAPQQGYAPQAGYQPPPPMPGMSMAPMVPGGAPPQQPGQQPGQFGAPPPAVPGAMPPPSSQGQGAYPGAPAPGVNPNGMPPPGMAPPSSAGNDTKGFGKAAAVGVGAGVMAGAAQHAHHAHQANAQNHHHPGGLAFFNHAKMHEQRNYVLIIDRSGSMAGRRWREAGEAIQVLAPFICRFDPDGVTVYLFETTFTKFEGIKSPDQVASIFSQHKPRGGTYLHKVLDAAFAEHFREFARTRRGTTILVVTDGEPSVKSAVERSIKDATHKMGADAELSVSFIQIGDDIGATRFLKNLDDSLRGAKFDIVDTMKDENAASMSFAQLIQLSITD